MRVVADRVSLDGPHGPLLPPTSLTVAEGELAVVRGEPGAAGTALALALTGRLRMTTGTVTVEGGPPGISLRALAAVVDAPGLTEPEAALPLRVVAGDELALAGRPARRAAVRTWLACRDCAADADTRFERLPAALRVRLLADLAAARRDVRLLVLDQPDRHGADVESWLLPAREHAERGLAVVVVTATTTAGALPWPTARLGETRQPEPPRCAPDPEPDEPEDHIEVTR
ncbi:hypothetical protein B0I33_107286 [Prauserella shujinwangii]|uniref:ABC transporter family protein n=1 Tax=Prauserella shujinwangii TaxID=1453103 RepID=A0A2T0LSR9_9PSEU|nr:ABC transporter ATP-binding protein [Prauserella shujinwangii]PRX46708.1 hypothetical protein B0I33_107286 [Prauserella shujinwangii]